VSWPSDEEVLQTVRTLATRYRAPCTTLIVGEVAGSPRTRGLHAAVHDALHRLRADGRLARVTHRGTDRWTVIHGRPRDLVTRLVSGGDDAEDG